MIEAFTVLPLIITTATAYVAAAGGIAALGLIAIVAAVRGTLRPRAARRTAQAAQKNVEPAEFGRCA